jgi:hypothetical protein
MLIFYNKYNTNIAIFLREFNSINLEIKLPIEKGKQNKLNSLDILITNLHSQLAFDISGYPHIVIKALQLFVGPWPIFQFLNPIHSR